MAKDTDLSPEQIHEDKPVKKPGRVQTAVNKAVRRAIMALLVLIIGFLIIWFAFLGPRAAEIAGLQSQATTAQQQVSTLQAQVAELEGVKAERLILSILVDVNSARYELASDRIDGAELALANTQLALTELKAQLGSEYASAVQSLQDRLDLTKVDLQKNDKFAALNDLEVLANNLLNLERGLSGQ